PICVGSIDAALGGKGELRTVGPGYLDLDILPRRERGEAANGEAVVAGQAERRAALALAELQRQNAHADEVRTVDALEALDDYRAHAEQAGALGGPVAARAGAVFLAGDHHQRGPVGLVLHRCV